MKNKGLGRLQADDASDLKYLMSRKLAAPGTVMPTKKTCSGDFLIPFRDMERLIREDGEACTAVEQKIKALA